MLHVMCNVLKSKGFSNMCSGAHVKVGTSGCVSQLDWSAVICEIIVPLWREIDRIAVGELKDLEMRILHCVLILAFAVLLKYFYWDSSNPLRNSPLNYLSSLQQAPPAQVTSYILATQWPPGVCDGNTGVTCQIKPVPTEFTIHGLWPQPNGAPSTEPFDANKIATLASELSKYWPNLKSKQQQIAFNIDFWKTEWNKHGKYSGLGVREYFEKSLELHKDAGQGLKAKLAAEKITPTIYNTYKLVDIQAAVTKINGGFSGTIICVQRKGSSNKQQIQEIRFRYTNSFQKQNNLSPSNCDPEILFPSPE
uniref:Extracellular ribonuclease LE n=1 Tax=Tanacetum cinerariifolium TaxID=118510 RepID=A0A6L2PCI0_TANCI|nr:extracellular ribonuclease LE [Tanacetum cinerariifolium]